MKAKVTKKVKITKREEAALTATNLIEPIVFEKTFMLPEEPLYLISAKNVNEAIGTYEWRHKKKTTVIYQIKSYFYFSMK